MSPPTNHHVSLSLIGRRAVLQYLKISKRIALAKSCPSVRTLHNTLGFLFKQVQIKEDRVVFDGCLTWKWSDQQMLTGPNGTVKSAGNLEDVVEFYLNRERTFVVDLRMEKMLEKPRAVGSASSYLLNQSHDWSLKAFCDEIKTEFGLEERYLRNSNIGVLWKKLEDGKEFAIKCIWGSRYRRYDFVARIVEEGSTVAPEDLCAPLRYNGLYINAYSHFTVAGIVKKEFIFTEIYVHFIESPNIFHFI
ncbi:unnamed protein product [Caenorhabditis sp. 36 PRJEB53466]|nr:unnamed protein product [Caenorhabditis sp. 36 PRJEB53466]